MEGVMKSKRVTINDVAKRAGVSKAAVSYVLNGVDKVSEETRAKVLQAIDELGYVPNISARNLATGKDKQHSKNNAILDQFPFFKEFIESFLLNKIQGADTDFDTDLKKWNSKQNYFPNELIDEMILKSKKTTIAVFMEIEQDFKRALIDSNPFYQEFLSGVEHTAKEHDLKIQVLNSSDVTSYKVIENQNYLGVIVLGYHPQELSNILRKLAIPVVIVDEYEYHPHFINITSEDEKAAFESVEYLILKGHTSIAFVGCMNEQGNFAEKRLNGYKEALKAYGLPVKKELIFISCNHYSYEEGFSKAEEIIKNKIKVHAVFCTSDIMAIGMMKAFLKHGYKIPEDISIIGFDNIQFSKYSNPELTTVDQNIFLKAETAVNVIVRKLQGRPVKNRYSLPASIVERESVGTLKYEEQKT